MVGDPQGFAKTLRHGAPAGELEGSATAATLVGLSPAAPARVEVDGDDGTGDEAALRLPGMQPSVSVETSVRSTVLPRRRSQPSAAEASGRPRFERMRLLGEGGMGQVELARDNDIRRTVAVKRLKGDTRSAEALLRFADEVRVVGQLEHPAIVPIYDVGKDADGEVYLVMKHLQGETMEAVIEHLQAKDPEYVERFALTHRVQIFLSILDAMRYAHARGIIHRDLKPANIMVGRYGEVTVLDWGIAKPIKPKTDGPAAAFALASTLLGSQDARLHATALGALAGTPMYMSPEQAASLNDELDERSDVYTLSVILVEWLGLEHPRKEKRSLIDLLGSIVHEEIPPAFFERMLMSGVPVPYLNVMSKGLVRDRDKRLQSVAELENALQAALEGRVAVTCHVTLAKRIAHDSLGWIDRHPIAYSLMFFGTLATLGLGTLWSLYLLVRALTS